MKNKNGYTVIDMVVVIALLGVVTFYTISKVSYALNNDETQKELYDTTIKYIETGAKNYGNTIVEDLKQQDQVVIVETLINEGFLTADKDGKIYNPKDESVSLNKNKVKLYYDEEKQEVKASFQDE